MNYITTTDNYFADLAAAIEEGLFTQSAKPKKALLYAEIERHNDEAADWAEQAATTAAAEAEEQAADWAEPESAREEPVEVTVEQPSVDIDALEVAGDEEAIQAALLAADEADAAAAEAVAVAQAAQVAQLKAARQAAKAGAAGKPRRSPQEVLDELECIYADVQQHGRKVIAQMSGTSPARLAKRLKAYALLEGDSAIRQAFLDGTVSYSFLQEAAARRDGPAQIQAAIGSAAS